MTQEQFLYWLQGFAELHPDAPSKEQWQAIRDHLKTMFDKKTPDYVSITTPDSLYGTVTVPYNPQQKQPVPAEGTFIC